MARFVTHNGRNLVVAIVVLVALSFLALKLPHAAGSFSRAFSHIASERIVWLFAALGAEAASFLAIGLANRQLVRATGNRIGIVWASLLSFASNGLYSLVPGGTVPAGGWLVEQYRRKGVEQQAALWTVVASSFSVAVTALGLLLVGCGAAGVGSVWALTVSGAGLVVGSVAFLRGTRSLHRLERLMARHGHRGVAFKALHRLSVTCAELGRFRAGTLSGTLALLLAGVSWVCQWMAFVATFHLLGYAVPLDSLLFAFTASEVLAAVAPLPSGTGVVEGGLVGALALTGVPIGHAIVGVVMFRVVCYWLVTGSSTLALVAVSHGTRRLLGVGGAAPEAEPAPVAVPSPMPLPTPVPQAVPVQLSTSSITGLGDADPRANPLR